MEQCIKAAAHCTVEAVSDPRFNPPLGGNQPIRAKPFYDCQPRQNDLAPATFFNEPTDHAFAGQSRLGMLIQPTPHLLCTFPRKHLVAVLLA
jgi:hypothetical protein